MSNDVVVVEPVLTAEKLASLLAVGCEAPNLEFKREIDLDQHRDVVELTKDVAAMRSCGGYIVVGADDQGNTTNKMNAWSTSKFDEAVVRPKVEKFLHQTDILTAQHEVDGAGVALIYVPRHPLGFTVVKALAEYTKPGGGQVVVMRPGDVFVRRGTSSERWRESDVEELLAPRDSGLHEKHRAEFAANVVAIQSGMQGQAIASGPVQALAWQLDQLSFENAVIELLRRDDLVPIRLFLVRIAGDALAAVNDGETEHFNAILDRLTSLGAIALTLDRAGITEGVVERMAQTYLGVNANLGVATSQPMSAPQAWLEILSRVEALGGLAVVMKEWTAVRTLANQPAPDDYYTNWLRHGLTMAARSGVFPTTPSGKPERGDLIPLARRVAHRLPALRPYAANDDGYDPEPGAEPRPTDPILDSICGFDALAALVNMTDDDAHQRDYYPSFGNYYAARSLPQWARILTDKAMRDELLPGVNDDRLGRAMSEVAELAHSVTRRWGLWDLDDPDVRQFVHDWRSADANRTAGDVP